MKKRLLKIALLLLAVLTTGSVNAATETYDFETAANAFGDANEHYPTYDGTRIFNVQNPSWINIEKMTLTQIDVNGRFAAEARSSSGFNLRKAGNNWNGLNSGYNAVRYFSILDLKAGDKVTITYNQGALQNYTRDGSATITGLADAAAIVSGTEYTIAADGRLDIKTGTEKVNIKKIVIKTSAKVSVTIDASAGGTTLVSTTPLDFTGSAVTAYYAKSASDGEVTFSPITKVAANTPIYIKGNAGTYEIDDLEGDADDATDNLLKGKAYATTPLQSTNETKYYVFGVKDTEPGFYPVSTSSTFTSAAGKAYLQLTADQVGGALARSIRMIFGDGSDITGINTAVVEKESRDDAWYTLQGARVSKPAHGIYIKNGKKIFVK